MCCLLFQPLLLIRLLLLIQLLLFIQFFCGDLNWAFVYGWKFIGCRHHRIRPKPMESLYQEADN